MGTKTRETKQGGYLLDWDRVGFLHDVPLFSLPPPPPCLTLPLPLLSKLSLSCCVLKHAPPRAPSAQSCALRANHRPVSISSPMQQAGDTLDVTFCSDLMQTSEGGGWEFALSPHNRFHMLLHPETNDAYLQATSKVRVVARIVEHTKPYR